MTTELITLNNDPMDDPRFAVCHARGSTFKKEGHFFKVEKGARTVVHRSLCLSGYFGSRCAICPHGAITVTLEVQDGSDRPER